MSRLTRMQQRYIWLAGSFPSLAVVQGRGYRRPRTMYHIDEETGELTIFGYGTPLISLVGRGLFKELQTPRFHALTKNGEAHFRKMLLRGDGGNLNQEIVEVRSSPSTTTKS